MMILPSPKDAVHKAWLYRILIAIIDDDDLSAVLRFKGGTCAAMLGWLDRFSSDLDFDFIGKEKDLPVLRKKCERLFKDLGCTIKDQSKNTLQYFLQYPAGSQGRSIIKIDATFPPPLANEYAPFRLKEIDRIVLCQNKETNVANKLVAVMGRYEKRQSIAGRDIYDIHHFLLNGFRYNGKVIQEQRKVSLGQFFSDLIVFIEQYVTQRIIDEDINHLLSSDQFKAIRKTLKQETLMLLRDERERISANP